MENAAEVSKQNVKRRKAPEDLQAIQADVATFAASLGFAQAAAGGGISSGFDDSDFRKTGSIQKGVQKTEARANEKVDKIPGKEKKDNKKKNGATDLVSGRERRKKVFAAEDNSGKSEVRSRKGKHANASVSNFDEVDKGGKKGPQAGPVKSRIHEILDKAMSGEEPTPAKKRKGTWNNYGDAEQGPSQSNRSFVGSGETGEANPVQRLRVEAQQLMEKAAQDFENSRHKDRDTKWLLTARRSGTSADKVAAMTVILQENPKANVRTLDALIAMLTSKAGKRHAAIGIDALKELFMFRLLPDRKLKYFSQQPFATLLENKERASQLVEWYWEDCLKERYEKFVVALEEATKDTLFFLKEKALKTVYELLKSKPEQERRLLATLVNKLGDPDRKMASNSSYLLSCLLTAHPNMKKVVVDEVEAFVFRSHVGLRARYYAAIFLNQIVLSNKGDGPALAKHLVDLYFSLFKAVTSVVDEHDLGNRNKKDVQNRKGFEKVQQAEQSADFTTEIDSRLLSALLTGVNRALPYIKDEDLDIVTQDNSVLFRLVHSTNFNVAVQALMLLHQLLTKNQAVSDRFYRALYSVLQSKGLVQSSKADMFLGLVFKALKSDVDSRRISAFAKRLAQVAMHQPAQFACGSLMLLSEILKAKPSLWNAVLHPEDNDDDDEHFDDVKDITDGDLTDGIESRGSENVNGVESVWPKKDCYDPRHRDPLYCNAHRSCWWELLILAGHVHPSVAAMARTLLAGANVVYNGDPLRDLALGAFLDRYTEKKLKARKSTESGTWHGSSLKMPTKMAESKPIRPVGEEFVLLAADQVAPEDAVFHKFYVTKSLKRSLKKKKKNQEDDDDVTGELLASDVLDGDDSDNDEVDAILEQEPDLEEMDVDDSEEEDSGDEDLAVNQQDDEEGSEVDEFDDSEDGEADALLEAGLAMSSDDDKAEEFDDSEDDADALLEAGLPMSSDDDEDGDDGSGDDKVVAIDCQGKLGGPAQNCALKAKKTMKHGRDKCSLGISAGGGMDSDSMLGTSNCRRKNSSRPGEDSIPKASTVKRKSSRAIDTKSLGSRNRNKKASVFQEAPSDSDDF